MSHFCLDGAVPADDMLWGEEQRQSQVGVEGSLGWRSGDEEIGPSTPFWKGWNVTGPIRHRL